MATRMSGRATCSMADDVRARKVRRRRPLPPVERRQVIEWGQNGMPFDEIARRLKRSRMRVRDLWVEGSTPTQRMLRRAHLRRRQLEALRR
jgi:hypothetical protein